MDCNQQKGLVKRLIDMDENYVACAPPASALAERTSDRLARLFDTHHERLYRLARRLAPTGDEALDLVQETFLKAARFARSIPTDAAGEGPWLVRTLVNIRRDQWRKSAVRRRHAEMTRQSEQPTSRQADIEAALMTRTAVWNALDILPPRRRAIVVMFELEGQSVAAIATLLGVSAITIRWHLSMGRRQLAERLRTYTGEANEDR